MSIAGSPVGVEEAAATLVGAGRDFTDAADSIASHARAVTADWTGTAADAALDAITALSNRVRVGADVCAGAGPVLRAYAAELRAAQQAWEAASDDADAATAATHTAQADERAAGAMGSATPEQAYASATAQTAAALAASEARDAVSAARTAMGDAVIRAERADAAAALAIDALTDQLSDMTGTAPTPGPAAAHTPTGHHQHHSGRHHGWFYDAVGGVGDGAWKIGPGAVGDLVGLIPTDATHHFASWVESGHDALERDYGADTDSGAYRGASIATQVAGFLIPGEGFVRTGELAARAEAALAEGGRLAEGTRGVLDPAAMESFMENGATVRHSATATAIGDDERTVQNFLRSQGAIGHDVILHGTRDGQPLINGYVTHPQQVAEAILANPEYTGGPINLVMCHGGRSAADELSHLLEVEVTGHDPLVDLDPKTGLVRYFERGPDGVLRQIGG